MFLAAANPVSNTVSSHEVSAQSTLAAQVETVVPMEAASPKIEVSVKKETSVTTDSNEMERITRAYLKDTPLLAEIARCESTFTQFNKDGSVLRGKVNSKDVGLLQINERYHLERAKKLNINIYTIEGNLEYGKLLYKEQGGQPWSASKPCWGKSSAAVAVAI